MKSILKQIINEWRSNLFLLVELLLVFIVLWYIVDLSTVTARIYNAPMGFNTDHCYNISVSKLTAKAAVYNSNLTSDDDMEHLLQLADRLRHRPGIEAVAISQNSIPYNEGSNSIGIGVDTTMLKARLYLVGLDFFRLFRYTASDGTAPDKMDKAIRNNELVISSNLTDGYPQTGMTDANSLLGREVPLRRLDSDNRSRIGAIGSPTRWSHFYASHEWGGAYIAAPLNLDEMKKRFDDVRYITLSVRATPDADDDFINHLMDDADRLYQIGNLYLLDVMPYYELRKVCELEDMNEMKTQLCVLGFLLMNIFLGVIGTFWFRTQHRRREVALRMAMGSSRRGVFLRLIYEGLILLSLVTLPAMVIALNVGIAELVDVYKMPFDAGRFLLGIILTWLLMALMIIAGIWYPASKAMRVQPAEALHDE